MPIYPVLASFVHNNTAIDFYRGDIDEGSIIESYSWDETESQMDGTVNGNSDIIVENKDSYLSINTLLNDQRDVSQENEVIDYTVQPGDSISSIADRFQVSNNSIYSANHFTKDSTINPGDVIKVPPVSGMIHKVRSGDTLAIIAKKYDVSEEKIRTQNGLDDSSMLIKWAVLVIPWATHDVEAEEEAKRIAEQKKARLLAEAKLNASSKKTTKTSKTSKTTKTKTTSKNGDYSLSAKGSASGFAWGNCTYFVAMYKNVDWRGNANQWLGNAAAKGHATGSKPSPGAIIVFSGRGYNPRYGHVGIVTSVRDDYIIIKDMNYRALNEITVRKIDKDDRAIMWYIYVN